MLAALDLNADRAWVLGGMPGRSAHAIHLESDQPELPLTLALDGRRIEVGRAGWQLIRRSPHLVCRGFLQRLGQACEWRQGRHVLDPSAAMRQVLALVRRKLGQPCRVLLVVPNYFSREQASLLAHLAHQSGLGAIGGVTRSLAAALHTYGDVPWHNIGVFVDIDDHALTLTLVRPTDSDMSILRRRVLPDLGLRVWKERLLARIAEGCVRTSRRDPRDSPEADQAVYEQLDRILDQASQNRPAEVEVRAVKWLQAFTLQAAEAVAACAPVAQQAAAAIHAATHWAEKQLTSASIYLTAGAARLPGLAAAVYQRSENRVPVTLLGPAAVAQAGFQLAQRIDAGELAPSFLDPAVALPFIERQDSPAMLPFPSLLRQTAEELS